MIVIKAVLFCWVSCFVSSACLSMVLWHKTNGCKGRPLMQDIKIIQYNKSEETQTAQYDTQQK